MTDCIMPSRLYLERVEPINCLLKSCNYKPCCSSVAFSSTLLENTLSTMSGNT